MALRRDLLPILLAAAFLLLGPAQAVAAPQWLDAEPQASSATPQTAPDVAEDAAGNSAAAWIAGDNVYVAERPRGGRWGPADPVTSSGGVNPETPQVAILPNGEQVVLWEVDFDVLAARRYARRGLERTADDRLDVLCRPAGAARGRRRPGRRLLDLDGRERSDGGQAARRRELEPADSIPLNSFLDPPTDIAIAPNGDVVVVGPDPAATRPACPARASRRAAVGTRRDDRGPPARPQRHRGGRPGTRRSPPSGPRPTSSRASVRPGWSSPPTARQGLRVTGTSSRPCSRICPAPQPAASAPRAASTWRSGPPTSGSPSGPSAGMAPAVSPRGCARRARPGSRPRP